MNDDIDYYVDVLIIIINRYHSRFFDCFVHPNLIETLTTDQKWPLTAVFFETGAMSVPTKSRNPSICGWGDWFQSYLTPFLRVLSISGFLKVIHAPKTPKRGFFQVPRKLTSSIAFFKSLQSGLPINLINTPMSRVSCPRDENSEKKKFESTEKNLQKRCESGTSKINFLHSVF